MVMVVGFRIEAVQARSRAGAIIARSPDRGKASGPQACCGPLALRHPAGGNGPGPAVSLLFPEFCLTSGGGGGMLREPANPTSAPDWPCDGVAQGAIRTLFCALGE